MVSKMSDFEEQLKWNEQLVRAQIALEELKKKNRDRGFPWWALFPLLLALWLALS